MCRRPFADGRIKNKFAWVAICNRSANRRHNSRKFPRDFPPKFPNRARGKRQDGQQQKHKILCKFPNSHQILWMDTKKITTTKNDQKNTKYSGNKNDHRQTDASKSVWFFVFSRDRYKDSGICDVCQMIVKYDIYCQKR